MVLETIQISRHIYLALQAVESYARHLLKQNPHLEEFLSKPVQETDPFKRHDPSNKRFSMYA